MAASKRFGIWFAIHNHYGISHRDRENTWAVYDDDDLTRAEAMKRAKRHADNISARKFHQYCTPDATVFNNKAAFLKEAAKLKMSCNVSDYPDSLPCE